MRIRVEIDETMENSEIIIRCKTFDDKILNVQKALNDILSENLGLTFYKGDKEYFFSLEKILFFETEENGISAHTIDDCFKVKFKLYELEEMLPGYFTRVSKSTILNINHIYSISRNIAGASLVEFRSTHKKVYVSRYYYKPLKIKLSEKRK